MWASSWGVGSSGAKGEAQWGTSSPSPLTHQWPGNWSWSGTPGGNVGRGVIHWGGDSQAFLLNRRFSQGGKNIPNDSWTMCTFSLVPVHVQVGHGPSHTSQRSYSRTRAAGRGRRNRWADSRKTALGCAEGRTRDDRWAEADLIVGGKDDAAVC